MTDENKSMGWVSIYRSLQDDDLWKSEPFTRGQAWVDLILLARHEAGHTRVRGIRVELARGSLSTAEDKLASRWQWSRGKVRRFLKELEEDGRIVQQKTRVSSVIAIANYNEYQHDGTTDGTIDGTTDGRQRGQQTDANNKERIKENPPIVPPRGEDEGGLSFSEEEKRQHSERMAAGVAAMFRNGDEDFKRFVKTWSDETTGVLATTPTWREWKKAIEGGATPDEIIGGIRMSQTTAGYAARGWQAPNASTWIRDEGWLDQASEEELRDICETEGRDVSGFGLQARKINCD